MHFQKTSSELTTCRGVCRHRHVLPAGPCQASGAVAAVPNAGSQAWCYPAARPGSSCPTSRQDLPCSQRGRERVSWGRARTVLRPQACRHTGRLLRSPGDAARGHQQGTRARRRGADRGQVPGAPSETHAAGETWTVNLRGSAVPGTRRALVPFGAPPVPSCTDLDGELNVCTSAGEQPTSTALPYCHPDIRVLLSSKMCPKASLPSCSRSQKPRSQTFSL